MPAPPIYVEILMRSGIDPLWEKTQDPECHQRWDLRFSSISYLAKADGAPQRFRYQTRIGAGLAISGTGESVATHEDDGVRTSVLRFWSSDRLSLISSGGGYWKYIPHGEHIRFITRYSYDCRFGFAGMLIDRCVFRPLLGWATAISFDCLRLWLERGISPDLSWLRFRTHAVARLAIAMVWLWHGLVPKLLFPHEEQALLLAAGLSATTATHTVQLAGIAEVMVAAAHLMTDRAWPLILTLVAMPLLAAGACLSAPQLLLSPFTPVSIGMAMMGLASVALLNSRCLPRARRCLRTPTAGAGA